MKSTKRSEKAQELIQEAIASRKELEKWLKGIYAEADLNVAKYTNGLLMSKILYILYPGIINIFEIEPPTNLKDKIKMWQFLNDKVLVQVGIRLQEWEIIKIARGTQNCVEGLLEKLWNFNKTQTEFKPTCPPPTAPKWSIAAASIEKPEAKEEKMEDNELVIATSPSMEKFVIEQIRASDPDTTLTSNEIIEKMTANATENLETADGAFSLLSAYTFNK